MVRSISAASQAKLDQNLGTEPALIIEIQWVDGGSIYKYADKNITGTEGKILNVKWFGQYRCSSERSVWYVQRFSSH